MLLEHSRSTTVKHLLQEYVEYSIAGADDGGILGFKSSAYLCTAERGDQFVWHATLPTLERRRDHRVKGLKLFGRISPEHHTLETVLYR
jgi:hypothetical protein